jgi:hypothetical protein
MIMRALALIVLTGVIAGGLPVAAEPAAGDAPAARPRPHHRPALTDAGKAAAVRAGAAALVKSRAEAPVAMVARSTQIATGATPSAMAASAVQAGFKLAAPSAVAARASQGAAAASVVTPAIATRADPAPHGGPAVTGNSTRIAARLDAGSSAPVIRPAEAGAARSASPDSVQQGARYQTDVSPSDAMPGASAQAASPGLVAATGPAPRSTDHGVTSATGAAKRVALVAPPLTLKGAARPAAARRR